MSALAKNYNRRKISFKFGKGSFLIAIISIGVFSLIVEMPINNILFIFIFGFLSAFILGSLGFITGLWAIKLGLKI